jgi:hypothetical protein
VDEAASSISLPSLRAPPPGERRGRNHAVAYIRERTRTNIAPDDRERFEEIAENELLGLHQREFREGHEAAVARLPFARKRVTCVWGPVPWHRLTIGGCGEDAPPAPR